MFPALVEDCVDTICSTVLLIRRHVLYSMYMVPFWFIVRVVVDVVLLNVRGVIWMVILLTEFTLKTRNVPAGTVMSSKPWNVSVMFPEEVAVGFELSMGTVHVSPTLTSERFNIPVMKGLAVALSVVSVPW